MNAPGRPVDAGMLTVDLASLGQLREAVTRQAQRWGLRGAAAQSMVLIAHELATNVIRHGGGTGRMWLWRQPGGVCCQVSDQGGGMAHPERAGKALTDPSATHGRGLWLIRQMAERLHVASGSGGTTVTAVVRHP